jgi:putative endopeptidase
MNRMLSLLVCAALVLGRVSAAAAETVSHGYDLASRDTTCKPCADFYCYATGGYLAHNPIPATYPMWGRSIELHERNQATLREIIESASANKNAPKGSIEQKIGDYFASYMDTVAIERAGLSPLQPEFDRIRKIANPDQLLAALAHLQENGVDVLFGFGSEQDPKHSTWVIAAAAQGGLGLPDRDYYTKTDPKSIEIREKYLAHVARMFELLGDKPEVAKTEAQTVMDMETALAKASLTRVERRDPVATYHKMGRPQLAEMTPHLAWPTYFALVGRADIDSVDVSSPVFFHTADSLLATTSLSDWKTYLRWHLIHTEAPALPARFVDENFNFYARTLSGTEEILPRWKRAVRATQGALGEAVGQLYVQRTFTPEAKARAQEMVNNLIAALRSDLQTLEWMGPETRKNAVAKLDAFTKKIGYPDKWRDYSSLAIDRGPYVLNRMRAAVFESHRDLNKIARPLDRTEWFMSPPEVNAYYDPGMNEIVFPAGILQPPFFDPEADDAVNYGGMGAVIGHEMTHGFDDRGSQFDANGNLVNWWTPEDKERFEERAECIVKQFGSFSIADSLHLNGKLVAGESIADLGGVTIAYVALEKSMEGKPRPGLIDGYTPEQRFFLGYAQFHTDAYRPEFERLIVTTDPHPLSRFRVNGPLSNLEMFAKAFGCKKGDPMVRPEKERCRIW